MSENKQCCSACEDAAKLCYDFGTSFGTGIHPNPHTKGVKDASTTIGNLIRSSCRHVLSGPTPDKDRFPNVYAAMNALGLDSDAMKRELLELAKEEGLLAAAYGKISQLESELSAKHPGADAVREACAIACRKFAPECCGRFERTGFDEPEHCCGKFEPRPMTAEECEEAIRALDLTALPSGTGGWIPVGDDSLPPVDGGDVITFSKTGHVIMLHPQHVRSAWSSAKLDGEECDFPYWQPKPAAPGQREAE